MRSLPIIFTQHHDGAGWSFVLLAAFTFAFVMVFRWLRQDLLRRNRSCLQVMVRPSHRLLTGTSLMFAGAIIMLVVGMPLKPMIAAGTWDLFAWWTELSFWVSDVGAAFIVIGLIIMMWRHFQDHFGKQIYVAIGAGIITIYLTGVILTELLIHALKGLE